MKIRILGAGWYGLHLAVTLGRDGHDVEIHEIRDRMFAGASGGNPARLHIGPHYPRSRLTRAACLDHAAQFMATYGYLTRAIPINIYAIAAHDSLVDFGTYCQVLRGEIEFITVHDPAEFGLANVEGAILTGERHIVIAEARTYFEREVGALVQYGRAAGAVNSPDWDLTIDCTFAALDAEAIDRYEPCLTVLLEGPTDRAVTVMDGPFGGIYPFDETQGLCSLTSASLTPLSKACRTYGEASALLGDVLQNRPEELGARCAAMLDQMAHFWPAARDIFKIVDFRTSVRAMPRSGADARLVDVVKVGEKAVRVRAGKIDAVFRAEALIRERLALCPPSLSAVSAPRSSVA
jgi:hypothetical protein